MPSSAKFVEILSDSAESDDEVLYVPFVKPPPPVIDLEVDEHVPSSSSSTPSCAVVNGAQPMTLSSPKNQKPEPTGSSKKNNSSAAASCGTFASANSSSSSFPSASASVDSAGTAQNVQTKPTGFQAVSPGAVQASSETEERSQVETVRTEPAPDTRSFNATGSDEVAQNQERAGRKSDGVGSGRSNKVGLAQKGNKRSASRDPAAPAPPRKRVTRQQRARQRTNEEIANFLTTLGIFEPATGGQIQTAGGGNGTGGLVGTGTPVNRRRKAAALKKITPHLESLSLIPPPPELDLDSILIPIPLEGAGPRPVNLSGSEGITVTTNTTITSSDSVAATVSKPSNASSPVGVAKKAESNNLPAAPSTAQEVTSKEVHSQACEEALAMETTEKSKDNAKESRKGETQKRAEAESNPSSLPKTQAQETTSASATQPASTTERRISLHEEIMNTLPSMRHVRPEDGIPNFLTRGERAKLSFNITSVLVPPAKSMQPERREKKERERVSVKDLTKARKKQKLISFLEKKLDHPVQQSPVIEAEVSPVANNQEVAAAADPPLTQLPRPMEVNVEPVPDSSSNASIQENEASAGGIENQDSVATAAEPLPLYLPSDWTPAMAEHYDAPSPPNFRMSSILRNMSDDRSLWATWENSFPPKPRRQNFGKCLNCHQSGHVASRCTEKRKKPRCYLCGKPGHNSYNSATSRYARKCICPNTLCLNCGRKQKINTYGCFGCIQTSRPVMCEICGAKGHQGEHCPDNWRRYFGTTSTEVGAKNQTKPEYRPRQETFCCICAQKGHSFFHCRSFNAGNAKMPLQNPRVIQELFETDTSKNTADSRPEVTFPSDEKLPPPRRNENERRSHETVYDHTPVRAGPSNQIQNRRQRTSTPKRPRCKDYPDCFNEPLPQSECFEISVEKGDHKLLLQLQEGQIPHSSRKCEMPDGAWVLKKRPVVHIVADTVKIPSAQVDIITLIGELNLQQELMQKKSEQPEPEIITLEEEDDEVQVLGELDGESAIKDPLTVSLLGSEAEQLLEEHLKPNGLISKLKKTFNVEVTTSKEKLSIAIAKGTGEDRKLAQKNIVFWLECQSANVKFELQTRLNEDEVYEPLRQKKNPGSPRNSNWSKKRKLPFKMEARPQSKKLNKNKKKKKRPEPSSQNRTNPGLDNYTGNKPEFIPPPPRDVNPYNLNGWAPPPPMNFYGGPQIPPPQPFYPPRTRPDDNPFQNDVYFNSHGGVDFGSRPIPQQPTGFFLDNNPNSNQQIPNQNPFRNSTMVPNPFHYSQDYNNSLRYDRPRMNHQAQQPHRNFNSQESRGGFRGVPRSPRKQARYFH